jgi:hypothetical protein
MSASTIPVPDTLHATFQALLPKLLTHADIYFRGVRCPDTRADKIAECMALAWKWLLRLQERGKDVNQFTMVFVYLVARAVKSGRRLTGQERAKDVLSSRAQRRHGFTVEELPASTRRPLDDIYSRVRGQQHLDAFEERLRDNTVTPPPDAAAFRVDFPDWLRTRTDRDRRIIDDMMCDERTMDLARKHGISPSRVSQLRREFMDDWERFCGEHLSPSSQHS